ncbi:sterol O-acyltransferase 1-like [Teleopsis dalmanni]|uniref:sterol O-acyltransferase 1-like n=1 Tax=Teleopsis dalmanni TaxID=139649 RepID=UPI0018CF527A|nr:sterol O-acyltransferase 1-like [Teleopsis dalmanni]
MVESSRNSSIQNESTEFTNHQMKLNFLRMKLEKFQHRLLEDVRERTTDFVDEIVGEMDFYEFNNREFKNWNLQYQNYATTPHKLMPSSSSDKSKNQAIRPDAPTKKTDNTAAQESSAKRLPQRLKQNFADKLFVSRESYLTALFKVNHIKTILHIFYVILLVLFLNTLCYSYFAEEKIKIGLEAFKSGFEKIEYVFVVWCFQHVFVFTVYFAFKIWALVRSKIYKSDLMLRYWSLSCLAIYISSQLYFGYLASIWCLKLDLPFVSAVVLLLESTRLLMKMHSYVRLIAAKVITGKLKVDDSAEDTSDNGLFLIPKFGRYLYFLFAPTLIYRDSYPRTSHIRWKFALTRLMEVVAVAFICSYLHERYIRAHFLNMCLEEVHVSTVIVKIFGMFMPSIIIFLCGFYTVLHSWLNFTAEILRFGDRLFYKDWWTSSSFDAYYRNWNIVVHDWLYEFIYKDFYQHVLKGSKAAAAFMVFLISAVVHEHILSLALQSFFPVLFFFFFVFSVPMFYITRNLPKTFGNVLLWGLLVVGNGIVISLYSMEYYASQNFLRSYESWFDYFIPTVWVCYNK